MPQSLARLLVHLVFSTKNREPFLSSAIQSKLHAYMAATCDHYDCPSLRVGGVADHVHLLFGLARTRALSEVVQAFKTSSSKWIKEQGPELAIFHWQAGYGAFSVSESNSAGVVAYIKDQAEHHRTVSFQEEYRRLLQRHEIAFDERYVWD